MAETPRFAHFVVLLFLGSAFFFVIGCVILLYAALRKSSVLALASAATLGALLVGYFTLLVGVSLLSPEKTLAVGHQKYFCEVDCHIAYSVQSSYSAFTLGPEASPTVAKGVFVIVKLQTWFDPNSISKFRGDVPLAPNPRRPYLVNDIGQRFEPWLTAASSVVDAGTPLTQPLGPGESYLTNLVFDVPPSSRHLRLLLLSDSGPVSKLVIDDENSLLHRKIYLDLPTLQAVRP
jgi:hypothetical protein